ncbi:hypothetical protein NL676_037678 [Syzygium grande]|nr:hypothetical protein NL676_037678 [Syzygium grande]
MVHRRGQSGTRSDPPAYQVNKRRPRFRSGELIWLRNLIDHTRVPPLFATGGKMGWLVSCTSIYDKAGDSTSVQCSMVTVSQGVARMSTFYRHHLFPHERAGASQSKSPERLTLWSNAKKPSPFENPSSIGRNSARAAMEMEIDDAPSARPGQQLPIGDEDLFKVAEGGDPAAFGAIARDQLARALSLRNEDGRSLLHVAASSGHAEIVDVLSGADQSASVINSKDEEGWAPLHSAASIGNVQIVEILLRKGADVKLKNDGGRTALHYAASKGWLKVAEILMSHGANINAKDKVGSTPLHRAASTGTHKLICYNREVALLLIRHGADIDLEDKEGYTVLGRASNDLRPALIDAAKAMIEG